MTDREKLEKVAAGYHQLMDHQRQQRETMALMLRSCLARLRSPDARKRREAIEGLEGFAALLENKEEKK